MRDTEFDDLDDEKSSPIAALAAAMGTPAATDDDINSSPMAALSAAMAAPPPDQVQPKDTLDEPSPFAAPTFGATGDVPALSSGPATSELDDDLRPRGGLRDLLATVTSSRRNLAIVGGGVGVILLASALVFCGGSKTKPTAKPTQTAKSTAPEPTPEPTPEPAPEPVPETTTPTAEGSAENLGPTPEELAAANEPSPESKEPTEAPTEASEPAEPTRPRNNATATTGTAKTGTTNSTKTTKTGGTKTGGTKTGTTKTTGTQPKTVATAEPRPATNVGGKQVVAESDAQARAGKSVAGVDQSALQKARGAYLSGNKRLAGGDATSATKHYRQALGYYSGYAAAYRGLGFAYEKLGDKPNAVTSFRNYINVAPAAADAGAIKQRIAALSR